jgi:hypothetical protein
MKIKNNIERGSLWAKDLGLVHMVHGKEGPMRVGLQGQAHSSGLKLCFHSRMDDMSSNCFFLNKVDNTPLINSNSGH